MEPIGDFEILEHAADKLNKFFQFDEEMDLRTAIKNSPNSDDLLYWSDPYMSNWEQQFQNIDFMPLPATILTDFSQMESASFMGLLPELNRAWVSVDNRLYLWDYSSPDNFTLYNGLSDVIVSVAIAVPKPGIFTDIVKYVLVVATTVEVVLLAVTVRGNSGSSCADIKLQNTQYTISADNSTIFKIVGTLKGRIFLAGNDRNLYELVYEADNDSWKTVLGLDPPYKCKKISHSSWSLINLLDPVFRVFGGTEDGLVDLAVDDARCILYGVSAGGNLSLFYLGRDGNSAISTISGFDIISHVQDYLMSKSSVSRNGGVVDPSLLRVVKLHVIDPTESSSMHLIISMSSGARVFLCMNTSSGKPVVSSSDIPNSIQVVSIRNPPSSRKLTDLLADRRDENRTPGPHFTATVNTCFYAHGVNVYASAYNQLQNDMIIGIGPDFIIRRGGHSVSSEPLRSLTESLCVVECEPPVKKIYDIQETCPQICDSSMSALRSLYVCSSTLSSLGASSSSAGSSIAAYQWRVCSERNDPTIPVGPPAALPYAGWERVDIKSGVSHEDHASGIIAPLSEMVLQHGPVGAYPQRRIKCLSNAGVHTLIKTRPADYLFRMLSRSSSSSYHIDPPVDYLADVGSFFEQYGALQACALCFGLACGLPGDAGGDIKSLQESALSASVGLSTLQRRAVSAILKYSDFPTYSGSGTQIAEHQQTSSRQNMFLSGVVNVADPRVVPGASPVCFSACHNGLYLFTSRLLRPVWSKILVDCRVVGTNEDGTTKTEHYLLLRRKELDVIMRPVLHLIRVLREYFAPTLANAEIMHAAAISSTTSGVQLKRQDEAASLVTKQVSILRSTGKSTAESSTIRNLEVSHQDKYESIAKKQEDSSIFRCYRLLCRVAQAYRLLDILIATGDQYGVTVPWTSLSGLSFCTLVISASAQAKVKAMVQAIVSKVTVGNIDPLVSQFDANCFMFFSAGDRLSFEASKLLEKANEIVVADNFSEERNLAISRGLSLLLRACVYWRSLDCVQIGRATTGLDSFCQKLCSLGTLECFDGVVDLALKTAENFRISERALFSVAEMESSVQDIGENISGDRSLYHGGCSPVRSESERDHFRNCCYEILLHCLQSVLSSEKIGLGAGVRHTSIVSATAGITLGIVFRMITRAAASSDDVKFHTKLYTCLLDENRDMLVRIDSKYIENFLLEQDPYLTYSYYTFHGMFSKAAQLMDVRAHIHGDGLKLDDRIQDLSRAVSSAQRAVAASRDAKTSAASAVVILNELEEKLEIAELQRLVLVALSSKLQFIVSADVQQLSSEDKSGLKSLEDIVIRLNERLWPVSELYNQVTEPYELWHLSLVIVHSCKHDDPNLILKLWMSVIYGIVPIRSELSIIQNFFSDKKRYLELSRHNAEFLSGAIFESNPQIWLNDLQNAVVDLGSQLLSVSTSGAADVEGVNTRNSSGWDFFPPTFPLNRLIEELEEIAALMTSVVEKNAHLDKVWSIERAWVAKCFQRVGIGHFALIESYLSVLDGAHGKSDEKRLQLLSSVSFILVEWTKLAAGYSVSKSFEARQLLEAARAGKLRIWIEKMGQNMSALIGSTRPFDQSSNEGIKFVLDGIRAELSEADHRVRAYLLG